jgi:PAS domain S-box-containing protein
MTDVDRPSIGILGKNPDAGDWAEVLAGPTVELVHGDDIESLLASDLNLVVVLAEPREALRICQAVAARPRPPAVTMLVRTESQPHPHTLLVKALVRGKREWETAFDAIVDPVALLDRGGVILRANLVLGRVLGRPITEVIGRHYSAVIGRPREASPDPIAASLADGQARTAEARFSGFAGVQQVTTSPLRDGEGPLKGVVVILKDLSEIKEQQERLLQAVRLADIGQLAAGVAHEINTPLASIALRAESLLRSAEDPRLQAVDSFKNFPRYLRTIDEEIFRCKKIIGALLEFSRSRKPETKETDLNLLAERAADLVGHQMKLKQVTLELQLEPSLPVIQADDGQLRQVLIALLMNALDATPPGGRIEIATGSDAERRVGLSVSDTGIGIPPEHLDKIFSPFFTTKPVGQGTGLGLAICHGIVTAHGGEIRVESEAQRGTRVSLLLPADGPGGGPPPEARPHG